jgi:Asp/Glu/hydantoin racemase
MKTKGKPSEVPVIGILGWQAGHEDTLSQLEEIPGNIAHPDTFHFPVIYKRVRGAYYQTVVVSPQTEVLEAMIEASKELEQEGVQAIMTSCGFNAIFQGELANAVDVPFFASSLIQVPIVSRMLSKDKKVGIITADRECLTAEHLRGAGILEETSVCILGIEDTEEFSRIRADPKAVLDVNKFGQEVVEVAKRLVKGDENVGAIVLECTDLPPFRAAIRRAVGLPVFDIVTLADMVYESLAGDRWGKEAKLESSEDMGLGNSEAPQIKVG